MPLWLEQARGLTVAETGLMMVSVAAMSVVATPIAARAIARRGPRPAVLGGALGVVAGGLPMLLYGPSTSPLLIIAAGAVLGAAVGFANLGLQSALYEAAPPGRMGAASGLFQTCRYIGAILCTLLIGVTFGARADSSGLHLIAVAIVLFGALVAVHGVHLRVRSR
jgi:MFS family permease